MNKKYQYLLLGIIEFVLGFLIAGIRISGKGFFGPNALQRLIQTVIFVTLFMKASKNFTKFLGD